MNVGTVEVRAQWRQRIPLRDGIHLSAIQYLPDDQANPAPAIFTLTPYIAQTHHDQGIFFASYGYPFLAVDVRGRGDSEGVFKPIVHEADDGYDVAEWIARQPFCDGQVAMWGGSYMGYTQWATASRLPPSLATIVPVAAPYRGCDSPLRNNIFVPYSVQWLVMVAGRALQEKAFADQAFWSGRFRQWFESGLPFAQIDSFLGYPSTVFQEWLSHPECDGYWDGWNPAPEQLGKLTLPILTITGACDANQPGALMHHRQHLRHASPEGRQRHYLVIGPWDHAGTRVPKREFLGLKVGPASMVDLARLHIEWYAWTMKRGPKPEFLRKNVAYYVMGAEEWRYVDTLDQATAASVQFYLQSTRNPTDVFKSGTLSADRAAGGPDEYVYDPKDVSHAGLESSLHPESRVDQHMTYAMIGRHLVYHSEPLAADMEITGFFELHAWLAIDQPDTDFRATVSEVAPDGTAMLLGQDSLRARYREDLREARLVRTKESLLYKFARFPFISRLVPKGARLRLVVGPINSIHSQRNYNSGGAVAQESMKDARVVTVRLFHDEARPSALTVPIGNSRIERA